MKFIDPFGLYLEGTRLTLGAQGEDVLLLQYRLQELGYIYEPFPEYGYFGPITESFVTRLKTLSGISDEGNNKGVVDKKMWRLLGLPFNKTLGEEFFGSSDTVSLGNKTIKFTIKGNNITIDYYPKFYINGSSSDDKYYIEEILLGIRDKWEKDNVYIQGVNANFKINIRSEVVTDKKYANLILNIKTGKVNGNVLGAINWDYKQKSRQIMTLNYENTAISLSRTTPDMLLRDLAAHEFSHVLGVFDAYSYILCPGATPDTSLLSENDIMRSKLNANMVIDDVVYEMVLYAWSYNKLQTFDNTIFGETSQAFYH